MKPTGYILFFFYITAAPLAAHQIDTGYASIQISRDTLRIECWFDTTDLQRAFLFAGGGEMLSEEDWKPHFAEMGAFFLERIRVRADYLPLPMALETVRCVRDAAGNLFVAFTFQKFPVAEDADLGVTFDLFDRFGESYKMLVKILSPRGASQFIAIGDAPTVRRPAEGEPRLGRQIAAFLRLGVEHIFIGVDHILFLLALLIPGGSLWKFFKIVSAFTVAHSLTLLAAALGWVALPERLVESAIALSIVYVAAENLFRARPTERWRITGLFGLVHGFGFAAVLGELGLPPRGMIPSLLAFNIGVEIGQIVIVSLMLPLVWWAARYRFQRYFVRVASAGVLFMGMSWFLQRAFDLPLVWI